MSAEWLETDGLGGFASGRADGVRTRRYHALLLAAMTPPTGRVVLVNGADAFVDCQAGRIALSSQRYSPDVTSPDGATRISSFHATPWPTWTFTLSTGVQIQHELMVQHGSPTVALSWRVIGETGPMRLVVRPFLSGRDTHSTHHENSAFAFLPAIEDERLVWQSYAGLPPVTALSNGEYRHDPQWYRGFQYDDERDRGLDFIEDLASPGEISFQLDAGPAVLLLSAGGADRESAPGTAARSWNALVKVEGARRRAFPTTLHRAADHYIVARGSGKTIVAGYPWFSDWGRDTFIALRGLCIAGDRLADARDILLEWSAHVSQGMLPNYFPEGGQNAEYNSVDASLWYVVAVHELLAATSAASVVGDEQRRALHKAVDAIVSGFAGGTRFGIRADDDGLLAAGARGYQLTWMDARVDGREITPRIGKPVEIQALWINALRVAGERNRKWGAIADHATRSFLDRFWYGDGGHLYDVVDVDHVRGTADASLRPNQIFAAGGLPYAILDGDRARRVVDVVESALLTPAGLRSLSPDASTYVPNYVGGPQVRDGAYHQGTVWAWLLGPFIEAWMRVRGNTTGARQEARTRFLVPMLEHYAESVPDQLSEIADANAPYTPRGCPFQAWSVGEALRVERDVLRVDAPPERGTRRKRARSV
ncbi:MAG: amylo-alpha-1,6-glucosidase [Gemmatimonadota bacterium]